MKYKYNGQWVDVNIKALDSMVIGSIIQFVGTTIPNGWLECDGSTITQSAYPELYNLIGGTLPDFRGKVLVGQDTNDTDFDTLLETGGSKYLQEHTHSVNSRATTFSGTGSNSPSQTSGDRSWNNLGVGNVQGVQTGNSGNLQPYAVVKHIIKAKNTTPTMASIVNTTNNSTEDAYSCDYENKHYGGVVLYNDATGENGNITLSDNINNYRYIEIYASWATEYCIPAVKLSTEDLTNNKFYISWNDVGNDKTIFNKQYTISGTSITKISMNYYIINKSETSTWDECRIHRVVGYK